MAWWELLKYIGSVIAAASVVLGCVWGWGKVTAWHRFSHDRINERLGNLEMDCKECEKIDRVTEDTKKVETTVIKRVEQFEASLTEKIEAMEERLLTSLTVRLDQMYTRYVRRVTRAVESVVIHDKNLSDEKKEEILARIRSDSDSW